MRISELKVGDQFQIKETAHSTLNGFIYKIKFEDCKHIIWKVLKRNKSTVVCENTIEHTTPIYFKFTSTGHWRSIGKNSSIELVGSK